MEKKKDQKPTGGSRLQKIEKIKKPSRLQKQDKILLAVAIVLAVALVGVLVWKSIFVRPELPDKTPGGSGTGTTQTGETVDEGIDYGEGIRPKVDGARKSQDFYTILVLGRDTGGGGNTDTMLLASYDVTNQKATVMSIPRDTMVNVNWDVKKINSVYGMNGGGDKGIKALYKEISQLVGFEPDYEVVVEWEAVGQIVDAIGGVYFDVPYDMDYHDPYQDLVIEQAKGYRLLTGDDAMQVIRWRQNDNSSPYGHKKKDGGIGDSGRMELQQNFLKAVIKQLLTPANIKNIGKIATVFQESVDTDLSFQEILWFGKAAVSGGLGVEDVEFLTMPWYGVGAFSRSYSKEFGRAHYLSYVVPVASELLDIVNNKLSPFVEQFTKADLDIMFVNKDGSIGSTTGYVEDKPAAVPPDLSPYQKPETEDTYEVDENGNLIDPETGEIVGTAPEGGTVIVVPEDGGNGEEPADTPQQPLLPEGSDPVTPPTGGGNPVPEAPVQSGNASGGGGENVVPAPEPEIPVVPEEPILPPMDEGVSFIEPPPEF